MVIGRESNAIFGIHIAIGDIPNNFFPEVVRASLGERNMNHRGLTSQFDVSYCEECCSSLCTAKEVKMQSNGVRLVLQEQCTTEMGLCHCQEYCSNESAMRNCYALEICKRSRRLILTRTYTPIIREVRTVCVRGQLFYSCGLCKGLRHGSRRIHHFERYNILKSRALLVKW